MNRKVAAFALALTISLTASGSFANTPEVRSITIGKASEVGKTHARPAIWRVKGKLGTVYLFGSVHALSPTVEWHTAAVTSAMAKADVFVFEIPDDANTAKVTQDLVTTKGSLPGGESLRAMLSPEAQQNFDSDLAFLEIPANAIDNKQPWLADLIVNFSALGRQTGASPQDGVDKAVAAEMASSGKEFRYLETVDQQIALIAPDDPKVELTEFEADLKDIRNRPTIYPDLLAAWAAGDVAKMDRISTESFKGHSRAENEFFEDRNTKWLAQIRDMLDGEKKTFFITVGAGHLAGVHGIPTLLRAAGYKVDGP
jgi:uncharacterized protein YbaP (TraB family)